MLLGIISAGFRPYGKSFKIVRFSGLRNETTRSLTLEEASTPILTVGEREVGGWISIGPMVVRDISAANDRSKLD